MKDISSRYSNDLRGEGDQYPRREAMSREELLQRNSAQQFEIEQLIREIEELEAEVVSLQAELERLKPDTLC